MATLTIFIVAVFVIGYLCIALESVTEINKAAIALLMCVGCWTLFMVSPGMYYPEIASGEVVHHISEVIEHHLGDAAGTLFFLMGAMTIVEIVETNGGFNFVRDAIKTRSKRKLMWRMVLMTFFLSAILDNLTNSSRERQTNKTFLLILFSQDTEIMIELIVFLDQFITIIGNTTGIVIRTSLADRCSKSLQMLNQSNLLVIESCICRQLF